MIMSDKDFLKKIDILYKQKAKLYNQISENKCKNIGILIDLEFEIEKIVNEEEFIEIEKLINEAIEKIKEDWVKNKWLIKQY